MRKNWIFKILLELHLASTVDNPSPLYALRRKHQLHCINRKWVEYIWNHCLDALYGTTVPHTIAWVGFTATSEYFQGNLCIKHNWTVNLLRTIYGRSYREEHKIELNTVLYPAAIRIQFIPYRLPWYIPSNRRRCTMHAKYSQYYQKVAQQLRLFWKNYMLAL